MIVIFYGIGLAFGLATGILAAVGFVMIVYRMIKNRKISKALSQDLLPIRRTVLWARKSGM